MKRNILIGLLAVLLIGLFSQSVYANDYEDGGVTIDQAFTTGNLGDSITVYNEVYESVTSLTITEGILNSKDFLWINENLVNLQTLEIMGNTKIHSTSDTPVATPDNIVPGNVFSELKNLKEVTITSAITVGDAAFYENYALTSVSLPMATSIGVEAFMSCISLANIDLPNAITIGDYAFYENYALTSVSLPMATSIEYGAFEHCEALESIDLPMATTIGHYTFYKNYALASVNLPKVESIKEGTFKHCEALESINLPKATTIGLDAFYKNYALKSVNLPIVTTIERKAFIDCTSLASANIPLVESIGVDAFSNCSALNSMVLGMTVPTVSSRNAFKNISSNSPTIYVPYGSAISYKEDTRDGDGTDDKWYGWDISEKSNDDDTLSDLTTSAGILDPAFDSSITIYTVNVTNDIESIEVTPVANDSNSTVTVEGEEVANGEAAEVALSVGINEINIVVTAEDGSTTSETVVTVKRAGTFSDSVILRDVTIKGDLVINASSVVLKDVTITGDLYITQGVGNGKIILNNVKAKTIVIRDKKNYRK